MAGGFGKGDYKPKVIKVTWGSAGNASDSFELGDGEVIVALETPATITGANATLQSLSGEDFVLTNTQAYKNTDVTVALTADTIHKVNPADSASIRKGKIYSDGSEAEGRNFFLHVRPAT